MKVVLLKYNAGNVQSVLYALERIGVSAMVTDDHEEDNDEATNCAQGLLAGEVPDAAAEAPPERFTCGLCPTLNVGNAA